MDTMIWVKALQWLRNSYRYYQRVRFFVHQLTVTTKVLYQCQSCEAFLVGLLFFKVSSQYQTETLDLCSQKDGWMPFSDLFHFTRGMICQQLSVCFALSLVRYPPTVGPMMKASVAEASRKTMKRGKRSDGTTSAKYACRCAGTSSWHPKKNGNMRRSHTAVQDSKQTSSSKASLWHFWCFPPWRWDCNRQRGQWSNARLETCVSRSVDSTPTPLKWNRSLSLSLCVKIDAMTHFAVQVKHKVYTDSVSLSRYLGPRALEHNASWHCQIVTKPEDRRALKWRRAKSSTLCDGPLNHCILAKRAQQRACPRTWDSRAVSCPRENQTTPEAHGSLGLCCTLQGLSESSVFEGQEISRAARMELWSS